MSTISFLFSTWSKLAYIVNFLEKVWMWQLLDFYPWGATCSQEKCKWIVSKCFIDFCQSLFEKNLLELFNKPQQQGVFSKTETAISRMKDGEEKNLLVINQEGVCNDWTTSPDFQISGCYSSGWKHHMNIDIFFGIFILIISGQPMTSKTVWMAIEKV